MFSAYLSRQEFKFFRLELSAYGKSKFSLLALSQGLATPPLSLEPIIGVTLPPHLREGAVSDISPRLPPTTPLFLGGGRDLRDLRSPLYDALFTK